MLRFVLALLVKRFRVDGIPHIAFLTPDAEVKTALVGAVPKSLLQEEVSALANVSVSGLCLFLSLTFSVNNV